MYCADGDVLALILSISSLVILVFTEISTVVQTIFFHGARNTMWAASGSNHRLNSRRGVFWNSGSSVCGLRLPPMNTNSFARLGNSGSMEMASARFVIG